MPAPVAVLWETVSAATAAGPVRPLEEIPLFSAIARVFRTPDLRRKIFFTLFIIAIYRLGAHVPTPFVNYPNVQSCLRETGSASEGLLSLVNLFSGGALLQLSIFALGVMPYITATIIVQLLRVVIPVSYTHLTLPTSDLV